MRSLRISHKLWLAVGCIVLAQLTVVGVAGVRSARAQAESDALSREMTQRVQTATRWAGLTETNAARTLALVLSTDAVVEQAFKGDIAATSARISELQKGAGSHGPHARRPRADGAHRHGAQGHDRSAQPGPPAQGRRQP